MTAHIAIRQATPADYATVYDLIRTAFETAEHRDGTEQDFAAGLRAGGNHIPQLELVAAHAGALIGHILLTRTHIILPDGRRYATLLVAPLSVLLEYRNTGVGSALMHEGLRIAAAMGYGAAFLLGDPGYYGRFGFAPAHLRGIRHEAFPEQYVLVREILPGALDAVQGTVVF